MAKTIVDSEESPWRATDRLVDVPEPSDGGASVSLGSVTLSATWLGSSSPYYQTVTVTGAEVTANSKVDLQPTESQLADLISGGVVLVVKNNNGTLTAYAVGAAPSAAMTLQCTVTEVSA